MPLRDDLLNPIPGDNPSGANLRYDPQLDKIKEARREDLDVEQGDWKTALKVADHKLVIRLAGELLATRSKDLQVTVWLIEAHVRQEGFPLVAPSFRLVNDLLREFWDTIHPQVVDEDDLELRATPLEWLGSKLAFYLKELPLTRDKYSWHKHQESRLVGYEASVVDNDVKTEKRNLMISEGKLTPEQFDASVAATKLDFFDSIALEMEESLAALEELNQFCNEKFGDASPNFLVTREVLEEIARTVRMMIKGKEKDRPAPPPESDEEEEASSEDSDSEASDSSAGSDSEVELIAGDEAAEPEEVEEAVPRKVKRKRTSSGLDPVDLEDAAERLDAICRYLRTENEVDVSPYLILRGFRWGEIRYAAPPIRPDLLEPPPTEVRVKIKQLHKKEDWNAVIPACEEAMAMPCGRGWLDLQRYVVQALEGRGFNEIVMAVKTTLRGLLTDLPELLDMTLTDDTPTANAETKAWIESSVMKTEEPAPAAALESTSDDSSSSDELSLSDDSSSSSDEMSLADTSEPAAVEETLPEPPPPIDLDEMPPILDEAPMETPEPLEEAAADEGPKDIFDQAIGEVKAGNTRAGIDLISKILATERSGRMRFKRRTQIAHLLVAAGQERIAKPILNQLASEVDERRLEEWEDNEAIAYSIELLLRCIVKDVGEAERRTELYTKMCRLDPVRALNHSYTNA